MKKQLFAFFSILILANAFAGIILYFVYFPWSTESDYEAAQQEVRSDLLDLNIRLASNDYKYSEAIIDRASFDLQREIKKKTLTELELPKDIEENLSSERYQIYMENFDGPIGILKINQEDSLVLGPYSASYDVVNLRDGFAYLLLLILFNGLCLWAANVYLRTKFQPANQAINQVSENLPKEEADVMLNVAKNTPKLAKQIYNLQNEFNRSLRNQRDLMHAVAHEFRGPMARISFAIDLLTSNKNLTNKPQLKADVEDSLEELDSLVKEVLDYSRLKDGHQALNLNHFNLQDSLESLIKKLSPLYPSKNFEVRNLQNTELDCYLDQKLIERCLLNLLRNAAKFSFSKVLVSVDFVDNLLTVNIEDDGSGIPPGKRKRIFEPFTRLDYSRNRDSGGAGLGLAIVAGITKRHNGSVSVHDSESLGGANFCLTLPKILQED